MVSQISVVINTFNEEKNIARVIKSVEWADEVVVCDMHSQDQTVAIAKKSGAKVVFHKNTGYVEPARNFAISKASKDWILVLDADEELPESLTKRLQELIQRGIKSDFVEIPRKNIIFGKWMKASFWWPDYQVRFFRKGSVVWSNKIHSKPETQGQGLQLPAEEKWAIMHHNYQTVGQFIERMNRYTTIEAEQLIKEGYKFDWRNLFSKPTSEFLSRFFANKGYKDGLHGLALSFLQAVSFLIVYLKVWELAGFKEDTIEIAEINEERKRSGNAINYWTKQVKSGNSLKDFLKRLIH